MAEFWTIAGAVFTGLLGVLVVLRLHQRRQNRLLWRALIELYPDTASSIYWGAVAAKKRSRR